MVYLEKQKQKGRIFYYLAQTVRLPNNKYKKIRKPLKSSRKPLTQKEETELLKQYTPEFEKLLNETNPENLTDFKHETFWDNEKLFSNKDIQVFEKIKKQYSIWEQKTNLDLKAKIKEQFLIRHIYDTNKSEGNTFSLKETELLLTKGIIDKTHKKREVYEIENTLKAFQFIEEYKNKLDIKFITTIHKLITQNTLLDPSNEGKIRRKGENVRMLGNLFICPSGGSSTKKLLKETIDKFYKYYKKDKFGAIVRLYSSFIAIHPFIDGNGRTSRMILNWCLMQEGLPPINLKSEEHEMHCNLLNDFAFGKNKQGLANYIYDKIIERSKSL